MQMKRSEFRIGATFWCGDREWRCTDIGIRVITAICLDDLEYVEYSPGPPEVTEIKRMSSRAEAEAAGWFKGPPYAEAESVFDEYDQPACSSDREGSGQNSIFDDHPISEWVSGPDAFKILCERRRQAHTKDDLGRTGLQ
jgi:hypothetical protein